MHIVQCVENSNHKSGVFSKNTVPGIHLSRSSLSQ